jgi:murein DD-endopeptidase MepM/ murein hydrolase activator NlpD
LNDMAQKGEGTMRGKNTLGDRLNNPLNIKWTGAEWQRNLGGTDSGVKATDGGSFVKFPSVDNGYRAAQELITAPSYTSLTVEQALRRWSGAGVTPGGSTGIKDIPKIGTFSGGKGGVPQKKRELVSNKYPNLKNGTQVGQLGNVTTPYGGKTKFENPHPGVDIANDIGTPIPAFAGGIVTGKSDGHTQGEKNGGNQVMIKDNEGNTHQYSHLNNLMVKEGQQVQPGQPIGTMGNTGAAYSNSGGTGSHLDYRIVNAYGKYVNPFNYIKKYL